MTPFDTILDMALPSDGPGWAALGLAAVCVALALVLPRTKLGRSPVPFWWWVGGWALVSVAASALYVHHYLEGGPRIIDATSYWLEARGLSSGLVSFPVDEPTASFRGRFLVHHAGSDGALHMGVIFPPGYPALLSLGFVLGVPLVIGPLLAGGLTLVTAHLARSLAASAEAGRVAAVLCALNACLRYHTADTMSHGLAALLLAGAVLAGWHAWHAGRRSLWVVAGLAAGWLAATRPASALALLLVAVPVLAVVMSKSRRVDPFWSLVGTLGPIALFALHQRVLTGAWFVSSQSLYYELADGPPGCFRYGLGPGIGCLVEHGDYVRSVAPDGYGVSAALTTTGRRLYLHLADVLNYAPFAVLVVAGIIARWRSRATWLAAGVPLALVLAYLPFYFDGCYPGGGARMLADGLPFELSLVAAAIVSWARRFEDRHRGRAAARWGAAGLCLVGFVLHAGHMHRMLRERDAGRPMYQPSLVRETLGPTPTGLLLVDTDHAFNLAYDPAARDPASSLVVARARYDDRDTLLWERLGRPAVWRYVYHPWGAAPRPPRIEVWQPPERGDELRFEAEAEWPPLDKSGGYAAPTHLSPEPCASAGRALALVRTGEPEACVTIALPLPQGKAAVRLRMVSEGVPPVRTWVEAGGRRYEVPLASEEISAWPGRDLCPDGRYGLDFPEIEVEGDGDGSGRWVVCSRAAWVALDRALVRQTPLRSEP